MDESVRRTRNWLEPGTEPAIHELIEDPIALLLRRRDGITACDVWRAVEAAGGGPAAPAETVGSRQNQPLAPLDVV